MILSHKLVSVAALVFTLASTETRLSNAANSQQASIFDIPSKTPEELKLIIDELPGLRATAQKNGFINTNSGTDDGTNHDSYYSNSRNTSNGDGITNPTPDTWRRPAAPRTPEEWAEQKQQKNQRTAERRARVKELIAQHQPEPGEITRMDPVDVRRIYGNAVKSDPDLDQEDNRWLRELGSSTVGSYGPGFMAPTDEYYDQWAQGYRMLGGFIDCDHDQGSGSGDNGNNGGNYNNNGKCSRWMMWAAYVNPNYSGGGRDEYFTYKNNYDDALDDAHWSVNSLDCHSPNTEWELLGVYRQEFYQFIEQISKHLWAIDDYEYVVALAGLAYMTDEDCSYVGYDNAGNNLYAGVMPYSGGMYMMGLYLDDTCLTPDTDSGMTYDDFGLTNDMNLGSKDDGCLDDDTLATLYGYWTATQEYSLELLNEVYSEYKYCTLCMDYPTYQDGYFIGDSGTDDDDIINQCWKFHSHDSYTCETGCLAVANAQSTILQVTYNGQSFGSSWDGSSGSGTSTSFDHFNKGYASDKASNLERFKANAFLTFNGVLFIATFLAFSVARGSRLDSSEKSRSLLGKDDRKKSRSASRSKKSSRSKSRSSTNRNSRSSSRRKSQSASRSRPIS